ncbi:S-layer protein domain-containing protein [Methanomethylovorans sp.]|uniref:S-layer protein domain-containing protein n=1 Tax=Methanomethylovorans sp. TaxID=2758717 RepID=UPI00351C3683
MKNTTIRVIIAACLLMIVGTASAAVLTEGTENTSNSSSIITPVLNSYETPDEPMTGFLNRDVAIVRGLVYNTTSIDEITWPNYGALQINASNFAGFYHDMDTGVSTESIWIYGYDIGGNIISQEGLDYKSEILPVDYKSSYLYGQYTIIGFLGEEYVPLAENRPYKFSRLLIDSNEKLILKAGQPLEMPEGYALEAKQIDVDNNIVWMEFSKDGEFVEDEIIDVSNGTIVWTCKADNIAGENDVPVLKVAVTEVFQGQTDSLAVVEGIWLTDIANVTQLYDGEQFGRMEIVEIGPNYLTLSNPHSITLKKGSYIELLGNFYLKVAADDNLRFYIVKEHEGSDACELRGEIAENAYVFEWTPVNFEGFYYDLDDGIGTERLELRGIEDTIIPENCSVYTSTPVNVSFKHPSWGEYKALGFIGEKYLAGYSSNAFGTGGDSVDILSNGMILKVLSDQDCATHMYPDSSLTLEEGYVLEVVQVDMDNNEIQLNLTKDGYQVDTQLIRGNSTYVYKTHFRNIQDVPLIAVSFSPIINPFEPYAQVNGIFQVSEDCLVLEQGDIFCKMEVESISDGIVMSNKDPIYLTRGTSLPLMGNFGFKVADSSELRFYPFVNVRAQSLEIVTFSPANSGIGSVEEDQQDFKVSTNEICDIAWLLNGVEVQANNSCRSASYSISPASGESYNITVLAMSSDEVVGMAWNLNIVDSDPVPNTTEPSTPVPNSTKPSVSSGGSGGGGGAASGEDYGNIQVKEIRQQNINRDSAVLYEFNEEKNAIDSIGFTSLKNAGTVSATIEVLKGRSSFVASDAPGTIYQNMNIWVGKTGFATPDNIKNATLRYRIDKAWIEENDIAESSIRMYRFHNNEWNALPTHKVSEDSGYVYFESETPGFSPFSITAYIKEEAADQEYQMSGQVSEPEPLYSTEDIDENMDRSADTDRKTPGLSFGAAIMVLACVTLLVRKKS